MPETLPVPIVLPDGTRLFVEARPIGSVQKTSATHTAQDFGQVLHALERVGTAISTSLAQLGAEKASAEFGFEFAVEAGQLTSLIAKGSGSTSLKVTIEWMRPTSAA